MSSNFIPILSTSPPPLDGDSFQDDDDDEFGEFASVPRFDNVSENLCSPNKSTGTNAEDSTNGLTECTKEIEDIAINGLEPQNDDFGDFSSFENHFPENGVCSSGVIFPKPSLSKHDATAIRVNLERHKDYRKVCFKGSNESDLDKQDDSFLPFGETRTDVVTGTSRENDVTNGERRLGGQEDSQSLSFWRSDQQDNTSQDSVTDSGLCSSSQRSETSPLPQSEAGICDGTLDATAHQKAEVCCSVVGLDSKDTEEVAQDFIPSSSGGNDSSSLVHTQNASHDDAFLSDPDGSRDVHPPVEPGIEGACAVETHASIPEVNVTDFAGDDDDFEEFGGFSGVSYSEDFSSAKDLSFVTNDDAAMETARTSFDSSGGSVRGESLGTPGDDLSPLPDDAVSREEVISDLNFPKTGFTDLRSGVIASRPQALITNDEFDHVGNEDGFSAQFNEDEWNDFADFESAASVECAPPAGQELLSSSEIPPLSSPPQDVTSDDGFADFDQVKFDDSADGFADFSSAAIEEPSCSWGTAGASVSSSFSSWNMTSHGTAKSFTLNRDAKEAQNVLAQLIATAFPSRSQSTSGETSPSMSYENAEMSILGVRPSKSRILWDHLQDFEQTPALCYRWANSHVFQQVLQALNIDSRNILRNPSIPIFASLGLGLLEPMKGPLAASKAETAAEDISVTNTSEMVIPPVHFDWSGSGLTNPLESERTSSVLLDLDFFYTSEPTLTKSQTLPKTSSLEDELLGPDLVSPKPASGNDLEKLLSSSKTTILQTKQKMRPPNLSEKATQVLDQLPDLSFMQAKVLMFPIKDSETS